MPTRNRAIQPSRRCQLGSHTQSATSMAGRVGNISRHSISQASENSTDTASTRGAVGLASQMAPSAMAASSTV